LDHNTVEDSIIPAILNATFPFDDPSEELHRCRWHATSPSVDNGVLSPPHVHLTLDH
jgi:hypothetical protein